MDSTFQKDLWIELLGFDNTLPDFGVKELLSRMTILPRGISILIWTTELIHSHNSLNQDAQLGPIHCSYYARPRNEERNRQDWTKFQLRDLISELHRSGIEAYVSFFDQIPEGGFWKRWGLPPVPQWIDDHQEIHYTLHIGKQGEGICPWKHLADGSLYEDFFFRQLEKFLLDYEFDGLHAADGYAHPRYPVCQADFSDDVIKQFEESEMLHVPEGETASRSDWILQNTRLEWCNFHAKRHAQFWRKGMAMLAKHGLKHLFNHCWTRDPFEAKYRYGIDYRMLSQAGVKSWVPEAQAAVIETEGWNISDIPMQDCFRAMIPRLAAYLPGCNLQLLNCIKDGMEQYNVLRHAPAFMDSDIYSIGNILCDGKRAVRGMLTCLSDGIRPAEWQRLDSTYLNAYDSVPFASFFPGVVWSDSALNKEFSAYCRKQFCSSFTFYSKLISQGAVLPEVLRIDNIGLTTGKALIILHPEYFDASQLATIKQSAHGNYAELGVTAQEQAFCRVYRNCKLVEECMSPLSLCEHREVSDWRKPLVESLPDNTFFQKTADLLNQNFSEIIPENSQDRHIRIWGYYTDPNTIKLFIGSEKRTYSNNSVLLKGHFISAEAHTDELVLPLVIEKVGENTRLRIKLPPSGTIPLTLKKEVSI